MEVVKKSYTQMTLAVRDEISRGLAAGLKQGVIARGAGFSSCSIGREIKRYSVTDVGYRAHWAQARAEAPPGAKDAIASLSLVHCGMKPVGSSNPATHQNRSPRH